MKFKHVNPRNVQHIVPSWAIDPLQLARKMDDLLDQAFAGRCPAWDADHRFWFDGSFNGDGWMFRLAEPADGDPVDFCGQLFLDHPDWSVSVPLNEILKGAPSLAGRHSLYVHAFDEEVPLHYFGITKQRWFDRLAQHESSARCGSQLLFHRAIRDKVGKKIAHRVLLTDLDYETAMGLEESWVEEFGLYPAGLNMIPGGFAGIKYLHTLGVAARSEVERDAAVEKLASADSIGGRHNPLCAARWISDQEYVNRVICGHSGRLTADQVRSIRMLSAGGASHDRIAAAIGDRVERVRRVIGGRRYGRVA